MFNIKRVQSKTTSEFLAVVHSSRDHAQSGRSLIDVHLESESFSQLMGKDACEAAKCYAIRVKSTICSYLIRNIYGIKCLLRLFNENGILQSRPNNATFNGISNIKYI